MKTISIFLYKLAIPLVVWPVLSGFSPTCSKADPLSKSEFVSPSDNEVLYFGSWTQVPQKTVPDRRQTRSPFAACEIAFRGTWVRYLSGTGPQNGLAVVYLDNTPVDTIDAYTPESHAGVALFEASGLKEDRIHTLRVVVLRNKNQAAEDHLQYIDGFEVPEVVDYPDVLRSMAMRELKEIGTGEKKFLSPEQWNPVDFAALAPEGDVVLLPGVLKEAFDRNIEYIIRSAADPVAGNWWVRTLPASSEGRILGAAAHSLRWSEQEDLRQVVDSIVNLIGGRQDPDGYCLPYDRSYMHPSPAEQPGEDERRNYDRMNLTRGMVAAGQAGNTQAYEIMRSFYDWFNGPGIYPTLLTGSYDGSGHNCNNGHAGGLQMYFSPYGRPDDLVNLERYFVQDFFIEQMKNEEPLALAYYPLHVAHCYVLLAYGAWLDHFRATGHSKYLEGALGAWEVVHNNYEHIGGTIAICEEEAGDYPPQSYYTRKHTGETCGSVFWADINHRLLRHFPEEERFATEIEKTIYNVILAAQDSAGNIRYHNHLHRKKDRPQHANTCCEVNGSPFIARLPEFIYSMDDEGVWINLYAASQITWDHGGRQVELITETAFPLDSKVEFTVKSKKSTDMQLRFRIPGWLDEPVDMLVNGKKVATGVPGTYKAIDRRWREGDRITMELPLKPRVTQYTGLDQHPEYDRYALSIGPVLMALVGARDLDLRVYDLAAVAFADAGTTALVHCSGQSGLPFPTILDTRGRAHDVFSCI